MSSDTPTKHKVEETLKPMMSGRVGPVDLTPYLQTEYVSLFESLEVRPEWRDEVNATASLCARYQQRYFAVGDPLGIPWWFIGIIHSLEAGFNFRAHLHNGDPLTARTVNVPVGRPMNGKPPFTWEDSAADALKLKGLDQWDRWDVSGTLYQMERYNGFGYRRRSVHTPYLWSGSTYYSTGKYVADHQFDPQAVSKQTGGAVVLRRMVDIGVVADLVRE